MPPKADYWKHFKVVGVVAYCLVAECQQPNISLGALPKPGEKKRQDRAISEMENHEMRFIDLRSKAGQVSFQNQVIFMIFEFK